MSAIDEGLTIDQFSSTIYLALETASKRAEAVHLILRSCASERSEDLAHFWEIGIEWIGFGTIEWRR